MQVLARLLQAGGALHEGPSEAGYQIFFTTNGSDVAHTGIVSRVGVSTVYTIEGNTSTGKGVVPNGGGVCEKSYPINDKSIIGYGMPDWTLVPDDKTEDDDIMMSKDDFRALFGELRRELQDNDAEPYSEAARKWAKDTGLVEGNGKTIGGEPNYMWQDFLTREQFVTVLYRFAVKMGKA